MTMKNINRIIVLSIMLVMSQACSLDEEPYGFLSTDKFYKSESDALSALANAYDALPTNEYYGRYLFYLESLGTEEFTLKPDAQPADHELDKWNVLSTNGDVEGVFFNAYMGINRCNMTLTHVPGINMNENVKNEVLGEAYFLRALHYFNLVRLFGEVPLRTKPVVGANEIPAAVASMNDIYSFIEEDLLKAEQLMDETMRDGRANKVAAQALLSKVYLQIASATASGVDLYDFTTDVDGYYQKAATYAEKVLNNAAGFNFWTGDLKELWDVDNQVGNEFIFSIAYHREGAIGEGDYSKFSMLQVPYVNGTKIKLGPDFSVEIPDGWSHMQTEIPFFNSFDNADKRKTELIVSHVKVGNADYTFPGALAYPFTRKYIDKNQVGDQTSHYVSVLRFSDIALVYAEAAGPTTEGYEWINKIRDRAGLPDLTPGLAPDAFRDAVIQERSFELAFEGSRLFDLRRTKKIDAVLNGIYNKNINAAQAYYYPIPQAEKDNNPLIN
jgi:starch-binding outer membrane protein, SusD/RagB family